MYVKKIRATLAIIAFLVIAAGWAIVCGLFDIGPEISAPVGILIGTGAFFLVDWIFDLIGIR